MTSPGIRIFALTFAQVLLSSCVVGPGYVKPDVQAPDRFVSQSVMNDLSPETDPSEFDPAESPVNWWQGFEDALLDELVDEALKNNYEIAASAARLKDAEARLMLARSGDRIRGDAEFGPSVGQRVTIGEDGGGSSEFDALGALSFAWPVDAFGRTQRDVEAALAQIEAASAALRGIALEISADVAGEYLRMRGNEQQLELLNESVALQKQTLAIVDSRFRAGLAPELDLRRAEAAVANLEADIPPLVESMQNSRNTLAALTGQFPGVYEEKLIQAADIPSYQDVVPAITPFDVIGMRPDVQQAEARLKQAVANIGVAKAEWYPVVQLSKRITLGASGASGEPTVGLLFATISGLISQFITDGGERQAVLDSAVARADEALAVYRQTLINAVEDVERSLASLQSSLEQQRSLEQAVESSRRSFQQAEILYRQGLTSFLDVVDAQRVLASAQQRLASVRTRYAVQIANLFRVMGAGINSPLASSETSGEYTQVNNTSN